MERGEDRPFSCRAKDSRGGTGDHPHKAHSHPTAAQSWDRLMYRSPSLLVVALDDDEKEEEEEGA
jgi:hypothetical protein